MRPTEKPDLLLKALYQYNGDGELHSMGRVTRNEKIQLNATGELKSMVSRLARDGFIEFKNLKFDQTARITTVGIFFCEKSSYAYEYYPIITQVQKMTVMSK